MNRLHNHHGIALVVLPIVVSIVILIIVFMETRGLSCNTLDSESSQATESVTGNPASTGSQGYCLIYGKYCLTTILHSK
jgi:hypothetical protein